MSPVSGGFRRPSSPLLESRLFLPGDPWTVSGLLCHVSGCCLPKSAACFHAKGTKMTRAAERRFRILQRSRNQGKPRPRQIRDLPLTEISGVQGRAAPPAGHTGAVVCCVGCRMHTGEPRLCGSYHSLEKHSNEMPIPSASIRREGFEIIKRDLLFLKATF